MTMAQQIMTIHRRIRSSPSSSWKLLVLLLLLSSSTGFVSGENCPTFLCLNNSTCSDAAPDVSDHPVDAFGNPLPMHTEIQRNGHHCACNEGFTGLRCGRVFETCEVEDHKCYNGGACIAGLKDAYGNDQLYCDCHNAVDSENVEQAYVGKYCETPQTNACNDDKSIFCVNGGTCRGGFADNPEDPCVCPPNYEGPHCEFVKGTVPDCDLDCENGGSCRLGLKHYVEAGDQYLVNFFSNNTGGMYCECPRGFYGDKCEVSSSECGDHHCFHFGVCIKAKPGGQQVVEHCDCSQADEDGKTWGGRYCQYEATDFCSNSKDENGLTFCVNGGSCDPTGSHKDCVCPSGFHGAICEFQDEEEDKENYEECSLTCQNGGTCRKGFKDLSFLNQFGIDLSQFNQTHKDFEHCVCPEGFVGVTCEHSVEVCGNGEHVCFYGTECVKQDGEYGCNCNQGFSAFNQVAGTYCQHKATTICASGTDLVSDGTAPTEFAFCVNDGTCSAERGGDCVCPDGFEGPHCEFLTVALQANDPKFNNSDDGGGRRFSVAGLFFFLLVLCVGGGILVGWFIKRNREQKQYKSDILAGLPNAENNFNMAPASDHSTVAPPPKDRNSNHTHEFTPDGAASSFSDAPAPTHTFTADGPVLSNGELEKEEELEVVEII